MTKEQEDKILSFAKGAKRRRELDSKVKARRIRARWPHFIAAMHAEFRAFVMKYNDALPVGIPRVRVIPGTNSITAKSARFSAAISDNVETLQLMMIYTTLRSRDVPPSELPFYCRLGDDEEIEIHDSPDEDDDRIIPPSTFMFNVLSPFFHEVSNPS